MAERHVDSAAAPDAAWAALSEPWQLAFGEAWASWCGGNFGIGAALAARLVDDADLVAVRDRRGSAADALAVLWDRLDGV